MNSNISKTILIGAFVGASALAPTLCYAGGSSLNASIPLDGWKQIGEMFKDINNRMNKNEEPQQEAKQKEDDPVKEAESQTNTSLDETRPHYPCNCKLANR
ncbi:MAG: hypothetical protein IPP74_05845 [Alphaproteobacteria bacterium]|nr:hypothetical protein [Alphaproteobacteria bacterium]